MKVYWILDKIDTKRAVCSSIKAVSKHTGIKYPTLSYQFSVKKNTSYETERYSIVRTELIKSKRNV